MKSTILVSLLAAASAKKEGIFKGAPTMRNPIMMNTAHGGIQLGEFISIMEGQHNRNLQTTGQGFGNDAGACNANGAQFTCISPSQLQQGSNTTIVENTITCDLDPAKGFNFQESENCLFQAKLTLEEFGSVRNCNCLVCPRGSAQAVALDCSMNAADPFIAGPCVSLDCSGRCNGTGAQVVNQPTPAPAGGEEGTPEEAASAASMIKTASFSVGVFLATAASFVSVYMV